VYAQGLADTRPSAENLREEISMTKGIMTALAIVGAVAFATNAMAQAAISLNSSKSNIYKSINISDATAVSACTKGGGTVGKDPKGKDACVTPAPKNKP
jgi:hypothetical protein